MSCALAATRVTVERPARTVRVSPVTASATHSRPDFEIPATISASAESTNEYRIGSPLFARAERPSRSAAPSSDPNPITEVSAPSVPGPRCSVKRTSAGSMNWIGGTANRPVRTVSASSEEMLREPHT
jgi:hypothetical protein